MLQQEYQVDLAEEVALEPQDRFFVLSCPSQGFQALAHSGEAGGRRDAEVGIEPGGAGVPVLLERRCLVERTLHKHVSPGEQFTGHLGLSKQGQRRFAIHYVAHWLRVARAIPVRRAARVG